MILQSVEEFPSLRQRQISAQMELAPATLTVGTQKVLPDCLLEVAHCHVVGDGGFGVGIGQ